MANRMFLGGWGGRFIVRTQTQLTLKLLVNLNFGFEPMQYRLLVRTLRRAAGGLPSGSVM